MRCGAGDCVQKLLRHMNGLLFFFSFSLLGSRKEELLDNACFEMDSPARLSSTCGV